MAQGTRGRWVRVAATGFGVLICTGLVGCMNTDKDKKDKLQPKQPTPGLPGMPMIGANGTATSKTGVPNQPFGAGGIQPAGGYGQARPGMGPVGSGQPGANPYGANAYGANDYGSANPNNPGSIGAPGRPGAQPSFVPSPLPGAGVQPSAPIAPTSWNGAAPVAPGSTVANASPAGYDLPLPPPPPGHSTAIGSELAVQPPTNNSFAPIPPSAPPAQFVGANGGK